MYTYPQFRLLSRILIAVLLLASTLTLASEQAAHSAPHLQASDFSASYGGFSHTRLTDSAIDDERAAIAVDRDGYAHIAFVYDVLSTNGAQIYYATNVSGSWTVVPLTFDTRSDDTPSIAVDTNGNVHILFVKYYSDSNGEIMYLKGDSGAGTWATTRLTTNALTDYAPSLAIDSAGNCYVAYMQGVSVADYQIVYATNHTGAWAHTPLTATASNWSPSIAVDGGWNVHIAYSRQGKIRYLTNTTGSWVDTEVTPTAENYDLPSIAVDPGGKVHIASFGVFAATQGYDHTLYYHTNASGAWVTTPRTATTNNSFIVPMNPSLTVDQAGRPHILYMDAGDVEAHLDSQKYGTWRSRAVTTIADTYGLTSVDRAMAIDHAGHAHIAYTADGMLGTNIHYARSEQPVGPRWEYADVGTSTYPGYDWDLDIGIDSGNSAHISYYNATASQLEYSTNAYGSWQSHVIDSNGDKGRYNGLPLLLTDSSPTILYYDATQGDVEAFRIGGGVWEPIDNTGDSGRYLSASKSPVDYSMATSYYDDDNDNLVYASYGPPDWTWITQTVDSAGDVGKYTSITQGTAGHPHISYYDATSGQVKYATYDGSSWSTEFVDSAAYLGFDFDTAIARSANGTLYIAFYDSLAGDLRLATQSVPGVWNPVTVDALGDVGQFNDIVVDGNGTVHIAYLDFTNGDLKYAHNEGGTWHIEIVDYVGQVGWYPAIAVDAQGWVHFAYYDMDAGVVRYARKIPVQIFLPLVLRNM